MAIEQPIWTPGIAKAAVDLSAKQFYCVKVTAEMTVDLTTAAGEAFFGILQNKPKLGEAASVMKVGLSKVVIGVGGLTAGATWECAADGTAIATTAGKAAAGEVLIGGAAGEIATVSVGTQVGGTISNAVVGVAAGKILNGGSHITTAGEAAANTLSIAHGLTTVASVIVMVLDAGNNVVTADADVTIAGANIVIADGATYNTVENQIIKWIAFGV